MPLYVSIHRDYIEGRGVDDPAEPYIIQAENPHTAIVETARLDNETNAYKVTPSMIEEETALVNLDVVFKAMRKQG